MITKLLNIVFILYCLAFTIQGVVIKVEDLPEKCDYTKCPKWEPNYINVHLVPHTHDDVGWLKTVEQYYYGLRNDIQKVGVQYILDTVVEELIRNKDRRFIYVETAFFSKWWEEQDEDMRMVVKELVRTGQLEFINGGWTMPDEATTHYNSLIDQSTLGLRILNDIFGKCGQPKVTWQIDPFGHSKEMASLYAQMNYDAMFFARQDYQDKENRMDKKTLEHVWQASAELGPNGDLFTGMMVNGYGPVAFNWDMIGGEDDAIVDNPESEEYNVFDVIQIFVSVARTYASSYASKNVMFPMGTDFQFQGAHSWFKNIDKLIKHVNDNSEKYGVRVFYSTPSCYAKALHESNLTWTTKTDDFFPYASDPNALWTGYFTSRPALKRMERVGNNFLQACKQLDVLANNEHQFQSNINKLKEAMATMQHHDAVSGTEKQHVANNYAKLLHFGMAQCQSVINNSYKKLFPKQNQEHQFCPYLNISSCPITEEAKQPVAIYLFNPLAHDLSNYTIRLPTNNDFYYQVYDANAENKPVDAVLVPIPEYVQKIPGRKSNAQKEIVFRANIKALGVSVYFLIPTKQQTSDSAKEVKGIRITTETILKTKNGLNVKFNSNGQISKLIKDNQVISFENGFYYYEGANDDIRNSGAYIFRPSKEEANKVNSENVESTLYLDDKYYLVQEVHQKFKESYIDQIIKLDPEKEFVEFEFVVGPIPVYDDMIGKEIVARYTTDLNSKGIFYTDSNGRQLLQRQWNYRPTWNYQVNEPISGNFYPVNSRIIINDKKQNLEMTILTDRSQGGSLTNKHNGSIDLMVHRRLLFDDGFGVSEALDEPGYDGKGLIIRGRHRVLLNKIKESAKKHRPLAQQMFMEPIISFTKGDDKTIDEYSAINQLPPNVHLLTLEQWTKDTFLLRLEHFFQNNEDTTLSKPVKMSLKNLFKTFDIIEAEELTLGANQPVSNLKNRMIFKYKSDTLNISSDDDHEINENLEIVLKPMQIRTFSIKIERK